MLYIATQLIWTLFAARLAEIRCPSLQSRMGPAGERGRGGGGGENRERAESKNELGAQKEGWLPLRDMARTFRLAEC